jgi:hypothetical protein
MTVERLQQLLTREETTHLELADEFLELIRLIDECVGENPRWEPELEMTRAVLAAASMFMIPDDNSEEDDIVFEQAVFERRALEAMDVLRARCKERNDLRSSRNTRQ